MNHMTAINNYIEILRSELKIRTANGIVSEISGITRPLEVNISDHKCNMHFLVFDHEDHDVLIRFLEFKDDISIDNENFSILTDEKTEKIYQTDIELSKDLYWDLSQNNMVPASELNPSEKLKFNSLANSAKGMFGKNLDELGQCSVRKHYFRLVDKDIAPIYTEPYRIPQMREIS
ncbi:unnamed protein product [Brachionus calyciflorus]|uniref:Uncharacterized protein n=1 Tax=Brachionus calyciflorus TaxID=104777 RepID=A0A814DPZ2_9BILA|nr:unnamed protein product [Brachionus calyciflorus]